MVFKKSKRETVYKFLKRKFYICHIIYDNYHKMYNNSFLEVLREIYLNPGIHKRKIARNIKLSMPSVDNALKRLKKSVKSKKEGN